MNQCWGAFKVPRCRAVGKKHRQTVAIKCTLYIFRTHKVIINLMYHSKCILMDKQLLLLLIFLWKNWIKRWIPSVFTNTKKTSAWWGSVFSCFLDFLPSTSYVVPNHIFLAGWWNNSHRIIPFPESKREKYKAVFTKKKVTFILLQMFTVKLLCKSTVKEKEWWVSLRLSKSVPVMNWSLWNDMIPHK